MMMMMMTMLMLDDGRVAGFHDGDFSVGFNDDDGDG